MTIAAVQTGASYDKAIGYDFTGRRILLVEDHVTNQQIAKKILNRTSAKVDIANDGIEAVAAASGQDYDLILMDVHMPRMNGLEATKIIRALGAAGNGPHSRAERQRIPGGSRALPGGGHGWHVVQTLPRGRAAAGGWEIVAAGVARRVTP